MNPLYNIALHGYAGAARVAALGSQKISDMLAGQKEACRAVASRRDRAGGYDVWIHAASLGEFEQGRPLIERLRRERPDCSILLTFFSPSGYKVRKNYELADAVTYLPFDTPAKVKEFLDSARPRMAIFVKYEFWGNYLQELSRRGIPTYIISSIFRPSQVFFKRWGWWARKMLRNFSHIYVQDENSRQLLGKIGIDNVTVAGDTRFDRVTDIMKTVKNVPVVEQFVKDSPFTMIVGSSWPPDESRYIPWLLKHPEVKAIIAPHEFDTSRLESLLKQFGGRARLLSELKSAEDMRGDEQVIIIDCFGLLSSLYRYGDIAWVGGGFGVSIHNINEAAVYDIPVVIGPRHEKFKEARDLLAEGGAFEVDSQGSVESVLDALRDDLEFRLRAGKAAGNYIKRNLGATDIIFAQLFKPEKN